MALTKKKKIISRMQSSDGKKLVYKRLPRGAAEEEEEGTCRRLTLPPAPQEERAFLAPQVRGSGRPTRRGPMRWLCGSVCTAAAAANSATLQEAGVVGDAVRTTTALQVNHKKNNTTQHQQQHNTTKQHTDQKRNRPPAVCISKLAGAGIAGAGIARAGISTATLPGGKGAGRADELGVFARRRHQAKVAVPSAHRVTHRLPPPGCVLCNPRACGVRNPTTDDAGSQGAVANVAPNIKENAVLKTTPRPPKPLSAAATPRQSPQHLHNGP